jgi:hypothetical protein
MRTLTKIKEAAIDMEVEFVKKNCPNCGIIDKGDYGRIFELKNKFEFKFKDQNGFVNWGCVQCCKEVKEIV